MLDKLLSFFKRRPPHLHPCDICSKLMVANGYGMCEDCMEKIDTLEGEEFHKWLASQPRFSQDL